jgi:predicted transcriptional regulator
MNKRGKLEIVKDILENIKKNSNCIKPTPLLRRSNISSVRFKEYYNELLEKGFVMEFEKKNEKFVSLQDKGVKFIEKYKVIKEFIDEFEL